MVWTGHTTRRVQAGASLLCGYTEAAVDGDACAAPHDDAVQECYVGLGQHAQRVVQAVLLPEEAACGSIGRRTERGWGLHQEGGDRPGSGILVGGVALEECRYKHVQHCMHMGACDLLLLDALVNAGSPLWLTCAFCSACKLAEGTSCSLEIETPGLSGLCVNTAAHRHLAELTSSPVADLMPSSGWPCTTPFTSPPAQKACQQHCIIVVRLGQ